MLTTKRAGELTFGLGQMKIINDLHNAGSRQQWQCDTERPEREKMNPMHKFVEDLCSKTKQKNKQWLEEMMRSKDYDFAC